MSSEHKIVGLKFKPFLIPKRFSIYKVICSYGANAVKIN